MADQKEVKRVPAQYIGSTMLMLAPGQGTGFNADGSRRESRMISQGDILLMPEREILGFTLLYEGEQPLDMGTGKRVKPDHQECSDQELADLGYQFHQGRSDFVLVDPAQPPAVDQNQSATPDASASSSSKGSKKGGAA